MSTLDDLLAQSPPVELFHYTSQAGLLGILESRMIRASKISHLNDAAELALAVGLARKHIDSLDIEAEIKSELLGDIEDIEGSSINIFVFSLTERGDQLSQWRGYTPTGAGYSIGFSVPFLTAMVDKSFGDLVLGPCSYNPFAHEKIIAELVNEAVRRRRGSGHTAPSPQEFRPTALPFLGALYFAAPFLKHEGFSEEREWRLVSRPVSHTDSRFKHRVGTSHLIPYLELSISQEAGEPANITQVIVGPTPHPRLARDAVFTLLASLEYKECAVEPSELPFRQW